MKNRILIVLALLCTFAQGARADKWDGHTITGVGEGWTWVGEIAATAVDR